MENFSVVQSIIRSGLVGDREGVNNQVLRLVKRLEKTGKAKEAAVLERLLAATNETKDITPSHVVVSRGYVIGERLPPNVNPPIDRETGARLCMIDFPSESDQNPIYSSSVSDVVEGVLQEWESEVALQAVGIVPTRSLMIYGPPGSGKTITAHYIAAKLGLPLVTARIDGLVSSFLGTTSRNIANLFDFANRYACVLLLDEFDALAKIRDDPQEIGEIKRVVNTLLQNLDLRQSLGITIAITNHEKLLDSAVWRRFETQIELGEPNDSARESLVERFLQPIQTSNATLKLLSYCLKGQTGANIERICTSVKRTLVLKGASHDAPGLFHAFQTVLSRIPHHDYLPARVLAIDEDAFVSLIANDDKFSLKQTEIGEATGYAQSRVSDLKKSKRHLQLEGISHAQ